MVFSNPDADIKVGGRYPGDQTVTKLEDLEEKLRSDIASRDAVYSAEQIEAFFKTLRKYSPMENDQDEFVKKGQESLPFSSFAEAMLQDLEETKRKNRKEIENDYKKRVEELNKEKAKLQKFEKQCKEKVESAEKERDQAVRSLAEFEKNFVNVTPYESGYGVINKSRFSADVKFEKSDSFEHTTLMYFTLRNNAKELWFQTKNAWIIVGLKNGKSQKYIISDQISNYFLHSKIGPQEKSGCLGIRLFNVFEEEISFIKLCNVTVATHSLSNTNIAPGVEFELYTSPDTKSVYNQ